MQPWMVRGGAVSLILLALVTNWWPESEENSTANGIISAVDAGANYPPDPLLEKKSDLPLPLRATLEFELYQGIKEHFDAFILQQDSTDIDLLLARYEVYLKPMELSTRGIAYALDLFGRYLNYKVELADLDVGSAQGLPVEVIRRRFARLDGLRDQWFSAEENDYLFAQERSYDEAALHRYAITQNKALSRKEKKQKIIAHFNQLDENDKVGLEATVTLDSIQDIRKMPKGLQYNELAAVIGVEAAGRMLETWQRQDEWKQRMVDIREQVREIQSDESMSSNLRTQLIAEMLNSEFTQQELRRVRVFLENPDLLNRQQ